MSWPNKETITPSVVDMLRVNMNFKDGEKLLVVSDVPRIADWQTALQSKLTETLERIVLARQVCEIAREAFPRASVYFLPFPATGGNSIEPESWVAAQMRVADVLLCLTTYSLSHTDAREGATKAGVRLASMPGFTHHMLAPGGPMAVDYNQVAAYTQRFADLLTETEEVIVRSPQGTDLRFSIHGRPGQVDDGLYGYIPKKWGNLPAGEAYVIPLEGTGEGTLVVPAGWYPGLTQDMIFTIEKGLVTALEGGGDVGDHFRHMLKLDSDVPFYRARRNLAELGVGTNPNAARPDNVLEAEKILGTVHIAIGDNIHMGGVVESDQHEDFVQPDVDLILDGRSVILNGQWQ
jgi:leucyl aminopeptidase (aminopeptidase T)